MESNNILEIKYTVFLEKVLSLFVSVLKQEKKNANLPNVYVNITQSRMSCNNNNNKKNDFPIINSKIYIYIYIYILITYTHAGIHTCLSPLIIILK